MNRFNRYLKKILVCFFTRNPYRVRTFAQLAGRPKGEPIDVPESFNQVLLHEPGAMIYYQPLPETIEQRLTTRFLGGQRRYRPGGILREPDRMLYSLSDGCILGQIGVVYHRGKRAFVSESAKEWHEHLDASPYTNILHMPESVYLKGVTLSCLTNSAEAGFYHFIFEAVVKLKFAEKIIPHVSTFLFNGPATEWKQNWLLRAGIDLTRIRWVENSGHYSCEQLLFTNRLIADQQISNWCVQSLKSLFRIPAFLQPDARPPKVFLISRKDFIRNIEWEQAILERFPSIERIDFSKFSTEETETRMAAATHIVGAHGAALSNIFLCKPGTRVLELYPIGKTYQPCYYRISSVCDLEYSVAYLDFSNKDHPDAGIAHLQDTMDVFFNNLTSYQV
ncbi:MAG TPA: glycosyltransferase family 61 protein [Mucilaginibacter sp.]